MPVFLPHSFTRPRPTPRKWCTFCTKTNLEDFFELIDGPLRYQFCDEACADAWVEYRHKHLDIATCLKLVPCERQRWLAERNLSSVQQLISSLLERDEALPSAGDAPSGVRDISNSKVSV